MSIIRTKHNKNFIIMNKICLQDDRLSWKAKGIYAYLMSLPNDWSIKTSEVIKHSTEGKTSLLSGIKELIQLGYCELIENRNTNGTFKDYDYIIKEIPQVDDPHSENPLTDNQPLLSNDINKKELNKELNNTSVLLPSDKTVGKLTKKSSFKKTAKKKYERKFNPDSLGGKLAQYFLDEIEKNNPSFPTPNMATWEGAFSGMIFVKGYSFSEIKDIIWFSQYDNFWKPIIINPYILKAKYETLKMQLRRFRIKEKQKAKEKIDVFEQARREFHKKSVEDEDFFMKNN